MYNLIVSNIKNMSEIFKQFFEKITKIVLFGFALTVCVGFFVGKLEAKDFMLLAGMVFTFYFSFKGKPEEPYAGK